MPDIQHLTLRAERLSQSVDWWNTAMICFVVFAAIAATAIGIATWKSVTESKKLAIAGGDLSRAKESQLSLELKDKDLKIAEVERGAKDADARIAEAQRGAAEAKIDLEHAVAESRAKQTELETAQRSTAEAQRDVAVAQLELKKYVNLVASAQSPRGVPSDIAAAILRKAPPRNIEIRYQEGNTETFLFASSISGFLRQGGWNVRGEPSPIASLVGIGGGTGLREIILVERHPERSRDESTSEGALWKTLVLLQRGMGQQSDETLTEEDFRLYVGPIIGALVAPLK